MNAPRRGMTATVNAQIGQMKDPMNVQIGLKSIATGTARGIVLQDGFARHFIGLPM